MSTSKTIPLKCELWARCVRSILHAREQCADDLDSHAVLSIAEHMRDTGAPFRARRIGGLPRPAAVAIAIGRATNAAFVATRGRAFLRPHRGDRRCRPRLAVLPLAMPVKHWISDFRPCRLNSQPAFHLMGPSLARGSTLARLPWGVRMNTHCKQRATAPASWRG
jgi:hypothetical protein